MTGPMDALELIMWLGSRGVSLDDEEKGAIRAALASAPAPSLAEARREALEEAARLVAESGPLTLQRKDLERRILALASPPQKDTRSTKEG